MNCFYIWLLHVLKNVTFGFIKSNNEIFIHLKKDYILSSFYFFNKHQNCQFKILADVTAIDYSVKKNRFELVYQILSVNFSNRISIKVSISSKVHISTISHIFIAACWYEREIFDLFGIFFKGHNDLRKILTDYGFDGHALRKDFPLSGFTECRYDCIKKRVVCEPVEVAQNFRSFSFSFGKNKGCENFYKFKIF